MKLAALRHSVLVDEVVEALWPEAEPGVGRIRIRNVLSRERERLAARHRELLEVVMDESESAGDMLRAIRLAEDAIFLQPYDESLYARAARLMAGLGWRYKALQMLRRAEEVAAELGVPASPSVRQLFVDLRSG